MWIGRCSHMKEVVTTLVTSSPTSAIFSDCEAVDRENNTGTELIVTRQFVGIFSDSSNGHQQRRRTIQLPPEPEREEEEKMSDSDEELLHMALSEKDNRPNASRRQPKTSMEEEDDDSNVEMLSISSEDEDAPNARGRKHKNQGGPNSKKRPGARPSSGNVDQGWDGGEPNCWKYVDEDELARRVREMREPRAASSSLNRNGSALGLKGLTNMQSFGRGAEALDPLGLGILDSRSMMLITATSDGNSLKEPLDQRTRDKLNHFSENFDCKLFLSRVHYRTMASDLELGAITLKTDLQGGTQQKKQLVKENFDCFVSCKTTIDDIESKLTQIDKDPQGAGTHQLYDAAKKIIAVANRACQPLFERQVQAEKIRSVQGMLQRFRTLFNLPSLIRGNISKGEYDLAVREYKKALSLVLPSHVGILKRVLEEVEKVMDEFKVMLHRSMEDPDLEISDLENTVKLLMELEPDSDPIWHYLNIQNQRMRALLEKCTQNYIARMELDIDPLNPDGSENPVDTAYINSTAEDALREKYLCKLTNVILHHLPYFWQSTLSIFSRKFAKVSTGNLETNAKVATDKADDKVGDMKYSRHSLDEVVEMVHTTISLYEKKVLGTFRDFEESNVLCNYMINVIKDIAKACKVVEEKESAPLSVVKTLHNLHFEITNVYILRLCSWMRVTMGDLSESWIPLSILERKNSPYTISFFPLEFRMVSVSAMDHISTMIQRLRSEAENSMYIQDMQESIRLSFLNCFLDFAAHLERLGCDLSINRSNWNDSHMQGFLSESGGNSDVHSERSVADTHKKILIVLSNVGYCKDEICEELYKKYMHIWSQPGRTGESYDDIRDLVSSFSGVEEKVLEQYTFTKATNIRTAALDYLLDAGVQWGGAPPVKGIRDATIDLMNTLVSVHAEVSSGDQPLTDKTLGILVEGLMDTFISLFHEHKEEQLKSLDPNGFCQLMLELEYFETVLGAYFSTEARASFTSLHDLLLEKAAECVIEASETPVHRRRTTCGCEDAMNEDSHPVATMAPDDLLALAQQFSSDLLEREIERTRLNISCFMESSLQPQKRNNISKNPSPTLPRVR
ncbi:Exocyst complex component SEC5B [Zostera marina]|uniref:Exocyst complex component SEC5 n=1 Tax=Zostera marina TaxID=29655 RepID=A0A0K9NSF5_ZOSMR|nr:Exocyst complex component SEC5B [Zostera marina]